MLTIDRHPKTLPIPNPLNVRYSKISKSRRQICKEKVWVCTTKKPVADLMPKGEKCVESECVNVVHDSTCVVVSDA